MIDSYTKTPRPLRHVDVDYLIDQTRCADCKDKPCLDSCPIDAIYRDEDDGLIKIKNTCFGCVLCRNACPDDAISLDVHMDPPIKENVPNINVNLTVKLIRIHVSDADIALEYVQLMPLNMASYFLKPLKEVRQLSLTRIHVSVV